MQPSPGDAPMSADSREIEAVVREQVAQELEAERDAYVKAAASVIDDGLRAHLTEVAGRLSIVAARTRAMP